MPNQFKYTTDERRSSVIYSTSVGKGGLYVPQDYIPPEATERVIDEEMERGDSSDQPLTYQSLSVNRNSTKSC